MQTIDKKELPERTLKIQPAKFWADRYFVDKSIISTAKKRAHLSPSLTGNFAADLGEDAKHWMAVAVLEEERENPMRDRLREVL